MSTALQDVLARIETLATGVLSGQAGVYVDVADPMSLELSPWASILPEGGPVEPWQGMDLHRDAINVHFGVRAERGSAAADALHQLLHAALATDATLAGLVESLRLEDQIYEREAADTTALIKKCKYRVTYLVSRNTL